VPHSNISRNILGLGLVSALVFVLVSGCSSPEQQIARGREYLARRQFDKAKTLFQTVLKRQPRNLEAMQEMAEMARDQEDWTEAEGWWKQMLDIDPNNQEALVGYWQSAWEPADSATRDSLARVISADLDDRISKAQDRLEILSTAVDLYGMTQDSARSKQVRNALTREFPESQKAYDIQGEEFYDGLYPIWNNDSAKVEYLLHFIRGKPKTVWRRTAYAWLLYSLNAIGHRDSLLAFSRINVTEFPDDPFALTTSARWLLETDRDVELAGKYAQRAVELEPVATCPAYYPEEQWKLEKAALFGSSRLMLARAYRTLGELDDAEKWLRVAIDEAPYTMDDDQNSSPQWEMLAEIQMQKHQDENAFGSAVNCLIGGDRTNTVSLKADSVLVEACKKTGRDPEQRQQLARKWANYRGPVFTDVTESAGLADRRESRVAWGDVDNDGDDDLMLGGHVLFVNQGDGTFTNKTEAAGITGPASGGVFGDYDNDGWLDFYAISSGKGDDADKLWHNRGDGTFQDVTAAAGSVRDDVSSEGAAWGDFNNDGFLDLYVANYEKPGETLGQGTPDRFYLNQGDGTFVESSAAMGMTPPMGHELCGRGVNWGDYDNDNDLDIYVSNYRLQENLLWENLGGKKASDAALIKGIAGVERDGWWGHTIGSEWGDYDNDGDLDLITANLAHPRYIDFSNRTCLYENSGAPNFSFTDRRSQAGIKYEETQSDPAWGDVDNDGDLDLYITCIYQNMRSFLYRNRGDGTFEDITYLSGTRAFNGWGSAFSDYDNDGDLDLLVASGSGVKLFRNDSPPSDWIQVKAIGTQSNKSAIGARVTVEQANHRQMREIEGGKGTTSQNSLIAHFGLGNEELPVRISVRFPSGNTKVLENVKLDQRIEVLE
jgi:tetratricopeptide (TPR) repeat protein